MVTLHVDVASPHNAEILISLLQSVSFVEAVRIEDYAIPAESPVAREHSYTEGLESLFGIWSGRDITLEQLRNQAWDKRA